MDGVILPPDDPMNAWLNYHHLLYFWAVAREGGLGPASKKLRLSHSTLSEQIQELEGNLGHKLFDRSGRTLVLTETGRRVFAYADEIFALGRELVDTVRGHPTGKPARLVVGIADVVPKVIVQRLLEPALALSNPVRLVCHEGEFERLLDRLAAHELDALIADGPVPPGRTIRAYNHLLGDSGVTFFGAKKLAGPARRRFPGALEGAPMLLPGQGTSLRRELDQWFDSVGVHPRVVAEFEDSALLKVFGASGYGLFVAPSVVESEMLKQYGVQVVGRVPDIRERYYVISPERKLKNPGVVAICSEATRSLFHA